VVPLSTKSSIKTFNKVAFLLSFTAVISSLISGLVLSLPD
jgi:hypothetical protein